MMQTNTVWCSLPPESKYKNVQVNSGIFLPYDPEHIQVRIFINWKEFEAYLQLGSRGLDLERFECGRVAPQNILTAIFLLFCLHKNTD